MPGSRPNSPRREQSGLGIGDANTLDGGRQEERHAVTRSIQAKIDSENCESNLPDQCSFTVIDAKWWCRPPTAEPTFQCCRTHPLRRASSPR